MKINKYTIIPAVTLIDVIICIVTDSIYCSANFLMIFVALMVQFFHIRLLLLGHYKENDSSFRLKKYELFILIIMPFFMIYVGNLGTDELWRSSDCPNTFIEYMIAR